MHHERIGASGKRTETGEPADIGVALSARALEGLPAAGRGHHGAGMMTHEYIVALPANNKTPFTFLELSWNPMGHEPDGVYQDVPHFGFHFYITWGAAAKEYRIALTQLALKKTMSISREHRATELAQAGAHARALEARAQAHAHDSSPPFAHRSSFAGVSLALGTSRSGC